MSSCAARARLAAFLCLIAPLPSTAQQLSAATPPAPPPVRTYTFTPMVGPVANPERGFSWPIDLFTSDSFADARRQHGVTLVRSNARLDAYRSQDLPASLLARIDTRLAEARAAGIKMILRFAYNEGPHPNSAPDASLAWIKRHIEQIKPHLQKNADVIAWLEAGFIGAWGEWHTSTNGLDRDLGAKRQVMDALLGALPASRSILLRTPADVVAVNGPDLPKANAAGIVPRLRVGHHNDCFLASADDSGTYRSIVADKALVAAYGRHAPIGGETCAVNLPRTGCPTALAELQQLGFSELNLGYHPGVIAGWRKGGCYDEIAARFGYRLVLDQVVMPAMLVRGTGAKITVRLRNVGFAPPLTERPVFLVLDGPVRRYFRLPFDPRSWAAGRDHRLEVIARVPADLPPGYYSLALWLPDAATSLQSDPRFAIQMASDGVWNQGSGLNVLVDRIPVLSAPVEMANPRTSGLRSPSAVVR
jgi:hypothetical protein